MNRAAAGTTPRPFAALVEANRPALLIAAAIVVAAVMLRVSMAPLFDGLDDFGYLEAAQRVSHGRALDDLFPLFRTRVGMAYPLGGLLHVGWLMPSQFWMLTVLADVITMVSLLIAGWLLTGAAMTGVFALALYALYPLAVQQSAMFYPTAFQVASIAIACAAIAGAERVETTRAQLGLGLAAGLALGIGYLVKEDVAIVVPALLIASVLTGFPRRSTMVAVMIGAASIFAAESAGYWIQTGHPLFRLAATSGLGSAPVDQLRISEIWRWDAFVRSLLLVPVQVGAYWWIALPAAWAAWRHGNPRMAFAATTFLILMLYLQFGSGSLMSYAPLPKTPRYTALVTPLLMLLIGAWFAELRQRRHLRVATVAGIAMIATALPCLAYLSIASSERTRNTVAVLPALRSAAPAEVFTDYYSARVLRIIEPDLPQVRVWYHARFDTNQFMVMNDPGHAHAAYVLLDRQAAKIYTSSYEMVLPAEIATPPLQWEPMWRGRAYGEHSLARAGLEFVRRMVNGLPAGNPLTRRVDRSISDLIDGDQATLYRVP